MATTTETVTLQHGKIKSYGMQKLNSLQTAFFERVRSFNLDKSIVSKIESVFNLLFDGLDKWVYEWLKAKLGQRVASKVTEAIADILTGLVSETVTVLAAIFTDTSYYKNLHAEAMKAWESQQNIVGKPFSYAARAATYIIATIAKVLMKVLGRNGYTLSEDGDARLEDYLNAKMGIKAEHAD